jgi:prophage antirepressor-like protein
MSIEQNLIIQQFNNLNIEIYGTYEEPLFKAKDIGNLLGIKNITSTLRDFDKDEVHSMYLIDSIGRKQETNMLTEQGLIKLLMISRKEIAKQFQKWVFDIIKQIRLNGKYELENKLKEKEQELLKYREIVYEEVVKAGRVYIISCDEPGIYKCGKTKNVSARIRGLQTACVQTIQVLFEYPTNNDLLLETAVHHILDRYRCNSNREHFRCDLEYMKRIVTIVGKVLDTLKSCYQTITDEELFRRLEYFNPEICNVIQDVPRDIQRDICTTSSQTEKNKSKTKEIAIQYEKCKMKDITTQSETLSNKVIATRTTQYDYNDLDLSQAENNKIPFADWLHKNIELKTGSILNLSKIYDAYFGFKISPRSSGKLRKEVESFLKYKFHSKVNHQMQDTSYNGQKYKGYLHIALKTQNP